MGRIFFYIKILLIVILLLGVNILIKFSWAEDSFSPTCEFENDLSDDSQLIAFEAKSTGCYFDKITNGIDVEKLAYQNNIPYEITHCGTMVYVKDQYCDRLKNLILNAQGYETSYTEIWAFLGLTFETGGVAEITINGQPTSTLSADEIGGSIWIMSKRSYKDFQLIGLFNYRGFDAKELEIPDVKSIDFMDCHWGFRYFPVYPTFRVAKIPVKLTFAGSCGAGFISVGYDTEMMFTWDVSAGFIITSKDNNFGIAFEAGYRPEKKFTYTYSASNYLSEIEVPLTISEVVSYRISLIFSP